eukprot:1664009-Rhodomonas_salina.6
MLRVPDTLSATCLRVPDTRASTTGLVLTLRMPLPEMVVPEEFLHRLCCYEISGTDIGYAAMKCPVLRQAMLLPGATTLPAMQQYGPLSPYAMSGTDLAYGTTASPTRVLSDARY